MRVVQKLSIHMYVWKIVFKVSLVRFSGRSALAIEKDIVDASEVLLQGIKTCRVAGKVLRTLAILFLGSDKVIKIYLQIPSTAVQWVVRIH